MLKARRVTARLPAPAAAAGFVAMAVAALLAPLAVLGGEPPKSQPCGDRRGEGEQANCEPSPELREYARRLRLAHYAWRLGKVVDARRVLAESQSELRGWEWRYLDHLFHSELKTLEAQEPNFYTGVRHVTFSPDGRLLAAACSDLKVKVWAIPSGDVKLHFHLETTEVAFSPDGAMLAGGVGGAVRIHDTKTGERRRVLHARSAVAGIPHRVEYSPDGSRLMSTDTSGGVRIWEIGTGEAVVELDDIEPVATFSPDGRRVAAVRRRYLPGENRQEIKVLLFDAATGETVAGPRFEIGRHDLRLFDLAFSPDGKVLAACGQEWRRAGAEHRSSGIVLVWKSENGEPAFTIHGHPDAVADVAFSPDSRRLGTASWDGTARLWDASSGAELSVFRGHTDRVTSVAFHPDGTLVATGSDDGTVRLWDATAGSQGFALASRPFGFRLVAVSADGSRLAGYRAEYDRETHRPRAVLEICDLATGSTLSTLRPEKFRGATQWAISTDGALVAAAISSPSGDPPANQHITVWDCASAKPWRTIEPESGEIAQLAFDPAGCRLAVATRRRSADKAGRLRFALYDLETEEETCAVQREVAGALEALAIAFSPDGGRVALGAGFQPRANVREGTVYVWDTQTGESAAEFRAPEGLVQNVAFSPDGRRLAAALFAGYGHAGGARLAVWDLAAKEPLYNMEAHGDAIHDLVYSPDGSVIATGGSGRWERGEIRLWHAATGMPVLALDDDFPHPVHSVAFQPNGALVSFDRWSVVRLLEVNSADAELREQRAARRRHPE